MSNALHLSFGEEQIRKLFGHEAAEDEDPGRLREYYFKSQTFQQVCADVPLRVVVGHKGVGKSALFRMALLEDEEANRLPIEVRPDDVHGIGVEEADFLDRIRAWKKGLRQIIADKILARLRVVEGLAGQELARKAGSLIVLLKDALRPLLDNSVDSSVANRPLITQFLGANKVIVYMDDLDRGWKGSPSDIQRLSALLNAVRDLSRESPGIYFRIALRSDVYF